MLILPTEIWHIIFRELDLKTKSQARLACSHWRDILNHESFWTNHMPKINTRPSKKPNLCKEQIRELKEGRFKKCKKIRYYPDTSHTDIYSILDTRDFTNKLDQSLLKLSFIETITKCYCHANGNSRIKYRIQGRTIPKYKWDIEYLETKEKHPDNNTQQNKCTEFRLSCSSCIYCVFFLRTQPRKASLVTRQFLGRQFTKCNQRLAYCDTIRTSNIPNTFLPLHCWKEKLIK